MFTVGYTTPLGSTGATPRPIGCLTRWLISSARFGEIERSFPEWRHRPPSSPSVGWDFLGLVKIEAMACDVDLCTVAWRRIHLVRIAPFFPSNTVDVTIGVRPLEEKAWIKRLGQSRRSEKSGTARKLGAQPEIWRQTRRGLQGAKAGPRLRRSEAFPPLPLPRSQLNGVPR